MEPPTGLLDDFDGQELPEGTEPVRLSLDGTVYFIKLSEENHEKLLEALRPFTEHAETQPLPGRMNNMR